MKVLWAGVLCFLALIQQDGHKLDVVRQPSGATKIEGEEPTVPDGGVLNVTFQRVVEKPNLAGRKIEPFVLPKPVGEKFCAVHKGKYKVDAVCPVPGTYQVTVAFEKGFPHSGSVGALFDKGKIEPWKVSRKFILGECKELKADLEAALPEVQKIIKQIESILDKLDQPVVDEKDAFSETRTADQILQEAERLVPRTALAGTAELLRILADQILNYIRFSHKQLAGKSTDPQGEDGLGKGAPAGNPADKPKPSELKPGDKSIGDTIQIDSMTNKGAPGPGRPSKDDKPQMKEPSEFVKKMRALLEHMKWFHLRETALILIARARPLLERTDGAAQADLQALAKFNAELSDGKDEAAEKYRKLTTVDEKHSLKIAFDEALKLGASDEEKAKMTPPPTPASVGALFDQIEPPLRSFADEKPKK
jgi:exonuclease VII small subunit